mgnify:CR=1 FL=1
MALNEISPDNLMRLVGTPDCPLLFDVCDASDFEADPWLVPASQQWANTDIDGLAEQLNAQRVVVICKKGLKISHGAASLLRARGIAAEA